MAPSGEPDSAVLLRRLLPFVPVVAIPSAAVVLAGLLGASRTLIGPCAAVAWCTTVVWGIRWAASRPYPVLVAITVLQAVLGLLSVAGTAMPAAVAIFVVAGGLIGVLLRPRAMLWVGLLFCVITVMTIATYPPPRLPGQDPSPIWALAPASSTILLGVLTRKTLVARLRAEELASMLDDANASLERSAVVGDRLAVARERVEVANELYHRLANSLAATQLHVEVAARKTGTGAIDGARASLATALAAIEEGMKELRHCVTLLRERHELALSEVVRAMVRTLPNDAIDTEVSVRGDEHRIDADREFALFRVIQESLAAGARDSGRGTLQLRLDYTGHSVGVDITGVGAGALTLPGRGLLEASERIRSYGGQLDVGAGASGAVVLRAEVPLSS
ncbi:MAG: histidine kinase [Myxococcota bacterium]